MLNDAVNSCPRRVVTAIWLREGRQKSLVSGTSWV